MLFILFFLIYYAMHLIFWLILFTERDYDNKRLVETKKEALLYLIPFIWFGYLMKVWKEYWMSLKD